MINAIATSAPAERSNTAKTTTTQITNSDSSNEGQHHNPSVNVNNGFSSPTKQSEFIGASLEEQGVCVKRCESDSSELASILATA